MPPLLVGALVVGAIAWLLSGRKKDTPPLLAIESPINSQPGITTGFPGVPIQTNITPVPSGTQANNPSTSASGVPNSAAPVVNVSQAPTQPTGAVAPLSPFYDTFSPFQNGMYSHQAPIVPVVPFDMPAADCGCGGGCKHGTPSTSCSSSRAVALNDCLAPGSVQQLKNTQPSVLSMWASNVASTKFGMFASVQNIISNQQGNSEYGDGNGATPASPFLTPIGVGSKAPYGY